MVSILGNSLQTVCPQNIHDYILGKARAQKTPSGMAESGLVKGKLALARAEDLETEFWENGILESRIGGSRKRGVST